MLGERTSDSHADRRTARREASKAEILDAAWALVREHGIAGLALRDLAARVGMRAPSLYQYFASKHAIYDAMFADGYRAALVEVGKRDAGGDARTAFKARARRFFEFCVADPARYQLLFQRTIPGFEPSAESYGIAVEMLEGLHEWFRANGVDDPATADLWTAILTGLVDQQISNDPSGDRWERLLDRAVDLFLDDVFATEVPF